MSRKVWDDYIAGVEDTKQCDVLLNMHSQGHLPRVKIKPRLRTNLKALNQFFSKDKPIKVTVRYCKCIQAVISVGDASKNGFRNSFFTKDGIDYLFSVWNTDNANQSSNYRKFQNCLIAIRHLGKKGDLSNLLLILATDNFVTETTIYKGTADSPLLLECVIEFFALQFKFNFTAIVTHISGKRMIQQGSDGLSLSCGNLNKGLMSGQDFLSFLLLNKTANDLSPALLQWVRSWAGRKIELLSPEDWLVRGHDIIGTEDKLPFDTDSCWKPKAHIYGCLPQQQLT